MDVRVLKAAVEGDVSAMREMHLLSPRRLKAARNKVPARHANQRLVYREKFTSD